MDVDRADIRAYAFEILITPEGVLTINMTWKVPTMGGFELVRDTPIAAIQDTDWALAVFSDLTPTAETAIEGAGYTLTGTWPSVT